MPPPQKEAPKEPRRAWILKPSESSNGNQIHPFSSLTNGTREAVASLLATGRPWVCQRYIERPLLLRGYKTHCRVYVLLVGQNDPARSVYMYKEVPVFVSTEQWSMNSLHNRYAHLTNRSIQQTHPDFTAEGHGMLHRPSHCLPCWPLAQERSFTSSPLQSLRVVALL